MMNPIKVLWLCHFSDSEVLSQLHPLHYVNEFAPWIPQTLHILEGDQRFEIYVFSPHPFISGIHKFEMRGIHYCFYNPYIPILGVPWPYFFKWDYISDFRKNKRITSRYVREINPDVIHLFGAENAYYSSTILPLLPSFPTIVSIQGFISNSNFLKHHSIAKQGSRIEQNIISRAHVFTYSQEKTYQDVKKINPNAVLTWFNYSSYKVSVPPDLDYTKQYDLVFFARICRDKGIVDLLRAVAIIKHYKQDISLCVIGSGNISEFIKIAVELGISQNVKWIGFLPSLDEVHKAVVKARISVLPTYNDIMPGTIKESMFLGIPVVAYATDSIPEINSEGEVIALVPKGDYYALSFKIMQLLNDEFYMRELAARGKLRASLMFDESNSKRANDLCKGYMIALNEFSNDKD